MSRKGRCCWHCYNLIELDSTQADGLPIGGGVGPFSGGGGGSPVDGESLNQRRNYQNGPQNII